MTIPPTWTREPGGLAYTLVSDGIRARVWRSKGKWEVIVSQRGGALSASDFTTAEDAKAWCEARIAARKAENDD